MTPAQHAARENACRWALSPQDQAIDVATKLNACPESLAWLRSLPADATAAAIWHECPRSSWLEFVANRVGGRSVVDTWHDTCPRVQRRCDCDCAGLLPRPS